ncbi:MAG TPA: hypothetical protein VHO91_05380 [Rhodopila sp.]|nr:hypothetical protein [Rhodopila sp.]
MKLFVTSTFPLSCSEGILSQVKEYKAHELSNEEDAPQTISFPQNVKLLVVAVVAVAIAVKDKPVLGVPLSLVGRGRGGGDLVVRGPVRQAAGASHVVLPFAARNVWPGIEISSWI